MGFRGLKTGRKSRVFGVQCAITTFVLVHVSAARAEADDYQVTTTADQAPLASQDAASQVTREDLDTRLPRSSPDALRYEPGVFVQQTAHGQGSAYIRGLTGQQTVLMFDDVRMNNSLYRQGPNQYFFTIDSLSLDRIEVTRGSASTLYGSDALGGVIRAYSLVPTQDEALHGRLISRFATADRTRGARAEVDAGWENFAARAGVGFRLVDELESGGPVYNPRDGVLPEVPTFRKDGRTQAGTGFDEMTADAMAVWRLNSHHRIKAAVFDYRQFDVPRTDNCPPPYAPFDECQLYEEQFRDIAYLRWDADHTGFGQHAHLILSYQLQHERRRQLRPFALADELGRDDVQTLGVTGAASKRLVRSPTWTSTLRYGADVYADFVDSKAWLVFSDLDLVRQRSRGQYIDGSTYAWGGVYADVDLNWNRRWVLGAGARVSHIQAQSPGDEASGTAPIDQTWNPAVGHLSVEWWATPAISVAANLDQGFRAPNLDDLTSRQRTGPGYQFENPDLRPERALTAEIGVLVRTPRLQLDGWLFHTWLDDAIARQPRNTDECPPETPACTGSWSRFRLVNLSGGSAILGGEAALLVRPSQTTNLRATVAYAYGEGPSPEQSREFERVPLSRIPPLNGTVEAAWHFAPGARLGAAFRWATLQDRLALQDESDARIPLGGTPGYAVFDLRAGYRLNPRVGVDVVFENLTDAAYRAHGSSVNGPGRSLSWQLELGF